MKKLVSLTLLLVVCLNCGAQKKFKIESEIWARGQTNVYLIRPTEGNDSILRVVRINFKGMGKKHNLIGRTGTFYPNGKGRRKTIFVFDKK